MTTVNGNLHQLMAAIRQEKGPGSVPTVVNLGMREKVKDGRAFMWSAAFLLLLLAAAQGYVSFRAQYGFVFAAKHQRAPSALEALGLDTGAVIFALLGLAHARMGRSAKIERTLNIACALGSAAMNVLAADLGSPRSIAVYVLPAVLYAACSDRLIATVGHAAGVEETSLWRWLGTGALYGARAVVAFPSTARGLRLRLLQATPLPQPSPQPKTPVQAVAVAPDRRPARARRPSPRRGESKKAVLLRLYADHPDYGDRAKVSAVAATLGPQANLQPGTARTYLYAALDGATP